MKVATRLSLAVLVGLMGFGIAGSAEAAICDVTTVLSTCTVNGAIFQQTGPQPTGTGNIDPFVRISANTDVEKGYNTSGRPLQFDENSSPNFTRDLLVADVPIVTIGGIAYREFLLDINQTGVDPLLSLHELQIFGTNTANLLGASGPNASGNISFGANATLLFDLDSNADNVVEMNYNLNTGSGSGDLIALIPLATLANFQFVTLFSTFGVPNNNNDGFEEWSVCKPACTPTPPQVAQPASLMLLGFGLTAMSLATARVARKRRSQK